MGVAVFGDERMITVGFPGGLMPDEALIRHLGYNIFVLQ